VCTVSVLQYLLYGEPFVLINIRREQRYMWPNLALDGSHSKYHGIAGVYLINSARLTYVPFNVYRLHSITKWRKNVDMRICCVREAFTNRMDLSNDLRVDPFWGIVCYGCNRQGCPIDTGQRRSILKSIQDHLSLSHDGVVQPVNVIKERANQIEHLMNVMASRQAICLSADDERRFLCGYLEAPIKAQRCSECKFITCEKMNSRRRHSSKCITQLYDKEMKVCIHGVKKLRATKWFTLNSDPRGDLLHCFYRKFLAVLPSTQRVVWRPSERERTKNVLDDYVDDDCDQEDVDTPMCKAHKTFDRGAFPQILTDGFQFGANFCQENIEKHDCFYHEVEYLTMKGASQPLLVDFVLDVYKAPVTDHFGGSWIGFAENFRLLIKKERSSGEARMHVISKLLFDQAIAGLSSVSTDFRTKINQVGNFRPAHRLVTLRETVLSMAGTNDDKDVTEVLEHDVNDIFLELVSIFKAADSSSGIPRQLNGQKSEDRLKKFSNLLGDYVVFLYRFYSSGMAGTGHNMNYVKGAMDGIFSKIDVIDDAVKNQQAVGRVLCLVIASLHLEEKDDYGSMIKNGYTDAELFCLAKGVNEEMHEDGAVMFNFKGPYTMHQAASGIAFVIRLLACAGCFHAHTSQDKQLQTLLSGPEVFVQSRTWVALARMQRIARSYEDKIEEGLEPAVATKSKKELDIDDVFRIKHPKTKAVVTITRNMLCNATARSHHDLKQISLSLLDFLKTKQILVFNVSDSRTEELDLSVPSHWNAFEVGVTGVLPQILDPGSFRLLTASKLNQNLRVRNSIYASTVAAKYTISLSDGRCYTVESHIIASLVSKQMEEDGEYLDQFLRHHRQFPIIFGALFSYVLRGAPRDTEILKFRCGVTNLFHTTGMKPDLKSVISDDSEDQQLLVRFNRTKHGSGGAVKGTFMMLPDFVTLALVNYLSCFRTAAVMYLERQNIDKKELHAMVTRIFQEVAMSVDGIRVKEWGSMSAPIMDYVNANFGLEKDAINSQMLRQVVAAVARSIDVYEKKLKKAEMSRTRAQGFNHEPATHDGNYGECVRLDGTRMARQVLDVGKEMDKTTHLFYGCPTLSINVMSIGSDGNEEVKPWRRLRLFDDETALGAVKFGASLNYKQMKDIQADILTEVSSACRDAIFVYPCGSGKTLVAYALVVHAFGCYLAALSDDKKECLLSERLTGKGIQNGLLRAKAMLKNRYVKMYLEFCKNDPCPPPPRLLNIVLCPFKSTVSELIVELNEKQLVRAVQFNAERLLQMVDMQIGSISFSQTRSFEVDVLVMTASSATNTTNRNAIERAKDAGIIGCVVFDEVHCCITNLEWMTDMCMLKNTRRHGVPVYGMTGTLQKKLQLEVAQILTLNVGMTCFETMSASSDSLVYSGTVRNKESTIGEWRKRKGQYRANNTMPVHIGIGMRHVQGTEQELLSTALDIVKNSRNVKHDGFKATRCLMLVATKAQARMLHESACRQPGIKEHGISLLMGQDNEKTISSFNEMYVRGDHYLGIATSVGAQSLNNVNLDLVVIVSMSYSSQLVCQGLARAGRKGQRSLCIYLHHTHLFKSLGRIQHESGLSYVESNLAGIDINNHEIRRALSPSSLTNFLGCKQNECQWEKLREELDDDSNHRLYKKDEWCCSNCCESIADYIDDVIRQPRKPFAGLSRLTNKKRTADSISTAPSKFLKNVDFFQVRRVPVTSSTNARSIAEGLENDPIETSKRRPSFIVPAHRQLLAVEHRHYPGDMSFVRSFVTASDTGYRNPNQCCIWHPGKNFHKANDSQILGVAMCRSSLSVFLKNGHTQNVCFKCGGNPSCCGGGGANCILQKFDDIRYNSNSNVCYQCAVFHDVGEKHQCTNCPRDRIFALVWWALRSNQGYKAVKKQWKESFETRDTSFPKKIPFVTVTESMKKEWKYALHFVVASYTRNLNFWTCVLRALCDEKHITRVS
jgi:superfamily II DNA or RNA helicase